MVRHDLVGTVGTAIREEGGRFISVQTSPFDIYRIPLDPSEQAEVACALSMTDDELREEIARRERAGRLAVIGDPGQPGQPAQPGGAVS